MQSPQGGPDGSTARPINVLLPSPAQIALALIMIKSRPPSLSLEEYLQQLRQHFSTNEPAAGGSHQRRSDDSSYWREAYERSEHEKARLLSRIRELEKQHAMESGKQDVFSPVSENHNGKRKRENQSAAKANSRSKRKTQSSKPEDIFGVGLDNRLETLQDVSHQQCTTPKDMYLSAYLHLSQNLMKPGLEDGVYCSSISTFRRAIISLLDDVLSPITKSQKLGKTLGELDCKKDLVKACNAFSRSYPTVLLALDQLAANEEQSRQIVAEIVLLFQNILSQLHTVTLIEANRKWEETKKKARILKRRASTVSNTDKNTVEICQQLSKMLWQMFVSLDLSRQGQPILLEGLICAFLDHLGSALSLVVFSEGGSSAKKKRPGLGILPPQGLVDTSDVDPAVAHETSLIQAPFLIQILQKALGVLKSSEDQCSGLYTPAISVSASARTQNFAASVKLSLQHTLLRGIFGDEDKYFDSALRRADPIENTSLNESILPVQKEGKDPNWFIGEVWKLLGWDILSGDGTSIS